MKRVKRSKAERQAVNSRVEKEVVLKKVSVSPIQHQYNASHISNGKCSNSHVLEGKKKQVK